MAKDNKLYLTVSKEWLLENYPKMTLKEMYDNNMIQDKPFKEETGVLSNHELVPSRNDEK